MYKDLGSVACLQQQTQKTWSREYHSLGRMKCFRKGWQTFVEQKACPSSQRSRSSWKGCWLNRRTKEWMTVSSVRAESDHSQASVWGGLRETQLLDVFISLTLCLISVVSISSIEPCFSFFPSAVSGFCLVLLRSFQVCPVLTRDHSVFLDA